MISAKSKLFDGVLDVRDKVFVEEQGISKFDEYDNYDKVGADAVFAVCYNEDGVVATGRLANVYGYYKISRIAVLKEYRGKSLGNLVVTTMLDFAFKHGAPKVNLWAQTPAVPFYEKIGFKVDGTEFIDLGKPHIPMIIEKSDYLENKNEK